MIDLKEYNYKVNELSPNVTALKEQITLYENVNAAIAEVNNSSAKMGEVQEKILNQTLTNIEKI